MLQTSVGPFGKLCGSAATSVGTWAEGLFTANDLLGGGGGPSRRFFGGGPGGQPGGPGWLCCGEPGGDGVAVLVGPCGDEVAGLIGQGELGSEQRKVGC